MSFADVYDIIEAVHERIFTDEKIRMRGNAILVYRLADLVGIAFHEPKKFPSFDEFYPDEDTKKEEPDIPQWKREQAGMAAWVEVYNARFRAKGGCS